MLDQYAGLGGGQRILMDLAGAFRRAGHAVRVMVPGEGTTKEALRANGFPVLPLPLPDMTAGRKPLAEKLLYPIHARRAARAIVAALEQERADLIYANAPRCVLPAVWASKRTGVPVACGLHLIFRAGMEHRLLSWCFSRPEVKRVVFCSDVVAEPFAQAAGPKGLKVLYWVNPDVLNAASGKEAARAGYGLSEGDVTVGVIGRISRTKGQRMFIEALSPLLSRYPGLKLLVAGAADFEDPAEEAAVEGLAARAPGRMTVTGRMVDSREFLDALDVLVVPSLWDEPFGLVAVEGMARRLPVVVTRSGGLQEIVADGETGFVVEKAPDALRSAVERLLADPGLRARMGEAGRERVRERFDPEKQMGRIIEACLGRS